MRKVLLLLAIIIGLPLLYLLLWPVPIDPASWTPPVPPALSGPYAPNDYLASVERLGAGVGRAPEDVAVDAQGRLYGGMEDGRIWRFQPDGSQPELFADTGGRPLGLHFDAAGNLVVADADNGLLAVDPDGEIEVLSTSHNGRPYRLVDDVDVAADGTIYFSDASHKFGLQDNILDLLEHQPNGRLLAYNPATGTTRLVLDRLYFANGVAVSPDQSFVLVVETGSFRLQRVWISGSRQGESEIFIDNLPGFPDGVSSDGVDTFWVALVSPRQPDVENMSPFLRKVVVRLPDSLLPAAKNYGFVLGLDVEGNVVHNLQDPSASYAQNSSVQQHGDMLYLGSLFEEAIGRVPVP
jgi:sugar lactone lactonase YvrE